MLLPPHAGVHARLATKSLAPGAMLAARAANPRPRASAFCFSSLLTFTGMFTMSTELSELASEVSSETSDVPELVVLDTEASELDPDKGS
jgi:hypothetical protein